MATNYQYDAADYGQQRVSVETPSQGLRWSRLSLRVLSIICSGATLGFAAYYNSYWSLGPLIMNGPPAILSIVWSVTDFIFLAGVGSRRGIHPAACIVVDTILTLALAAMSGVLAFTVSKLSDSGWYFAFFKGEAGVEYLRIVLAFAILTAVFHLTALILAIVELKQGRRRAKRANYAPGHHDGSFPHDQHQGRPAWGEAPPAYSGAPRMTQDPARGQQDEVSTALPLYELPGKKVKARAEMQ